MSPAGSRSRSRIRRALAAAAKGVALCVVLFAALCFGAILHLNLPGGRAAAAELASTLASDALVGDIRVGAVDRILPQSVRMRNVRAVDASGEEVVRVTQLRVRLNILRLLTELLLPDDVLDIVLDHVRVEEAVVTVVENPATKLPRIAEAFTPTPARITNRGGSRRAVRVFLPSIELGTASVKLRLAGAPEIDGRLTRVHASLAADSSGAGIDVARFAVQARESSGLVASGTGSFQLNTAGRLWTTFAGHLGQVELSARLGIKGRHVALAAELPYARPEDVRTIWPEYPVVVPASGSLSLVGDAPSLRAKLALELEGAGAVGASGPLDIDRLRADLAIHSHDLNLRAFHQEAPSVLLTSAGGITIRRPKLEWIADVSLRTSPTLLWGEPIPSLEAVAHYDSQALSGTAVLHEPGAPARAAYRLAPDKPLHLDVEVPWFTLERAPRLKKYLPGVAGSVRTDVSLDVEADSLVSRATLETRRLSRGAAALASGSLQLELSGDPRNPKDFRITTRTKAIGARYDATTFATASLNTSGALLQPSFVLSLADPQRARIEVHGQLNLDDRVELGPLRFALKRHGHALDGRLDHASVRDGALALTGLSLRQGSGSLRGRATLSRNLVEVDLHAHSLDVGRTAEILGLGPNLVAGTIDCDATLTEHAAVSRRAALSLRAQDARVGTSPKVTATVEVSLDDEALTGSAISEVEGMGILSGRWDASLAGSVMDPEAWMALTGDALFELNYLRLSALETFVGRHLPVSHIDGAGYAQLRILREEPGALPHLMFVGVTQGLALDVQTPAALSRGNVTVTSAPGVGPLLDAGAGSEAPSGSDPIGPGGSVVESGTTVTNPPQAQTLELRGVDLEVALTLDQTTGDLQGNVKLVHGREPWVSASGSLNLELSTDDLVTGAIWKRLPDARFQLQTAILERPVAELPEWIPVSLPAETVSADLALSGSMRAPIAMGNLRLKGVAMPGSQLVTPADVDLRATYDFVRSSLVAYGKATVKGRQVALLQAQSIPQAAIGAAGTQTRRTHGLLSLDGLPLTVIAPVADADIDGTVFGTVAIEQSEGEPEVTANLRVESLAVDLLPLGRARLVARSDGPVINARARFSKDQGSLEARIITPIDWSEIIPRIPEDGSVAIGIDAEDYDAAILAPFVTDLFGELGGSIDADLAIDLEGHRTTDDAPDKAGSTNDSQDWGQSLGKWHSSVKGTVSLRNGIVQERSLGLELRDVRFDLAAKTQRGLTAIELRDVEACARAESPNLQAEGVLYFKGLDFVRGTGSMSFQKFPLVVDGVSRAEATGGANVQVEKQRNEMNVTVSIPDLNAVLPRNQGRSVITLDHDSSIELLQPLEAPSTPRGPDALPWRIRVELGNRVRATRDEIDVPFRGTPEIWVSDELAVRGELELVPGGHVELLGKVFVVESGVIRFDGADPSDPSVYITVVWKGPTHLVTVRLAGPLSNATLSLTSDPPLPEAEVFALILGGRPEEGGSATATGFSVGSQLWNDVFSNTALSVVNIRATSEEERAKYTAAVRVSEEVWFEASYRTGADRAQTSPGASGTEPGVSGTVDWRFSRDWSLRTDIGTLGAGFDLLWQYRY